MVTKDLLHMARRSRPKAAIPVFGFLFLLLFLLGPIAKLLLGEVEYLDSLYRSLTLNIHIEGFVEHSYNIYDLMPDYGYIVISAPGAFLLFIFSCVLTYRKPPYAFLIVLEVLSSLAVYGLMATILLAPDGLINADVMDLLSEIYLYCTYAYLGTFGLLGLISLFDPLLIAPRYQEIYQLRRLAIITAKKPSIAKKTYNRLYRKKKYAELLEFLYSPYLDSSSSRPLTTGAAEYIAYSGALAAKANEQHRLMEMIKTGQVASAKEEARKNKEEAAKRLQDVYYVDPDTVPAFLDDVKRKRLEAKNPISNIPDKKALSISKKSERKAAKEARKLRERTYRKAKAD